MSKPEMSLADKQKLLKNLVKKTQAANNGSKHVLSFASDRLDELKYEFIATPSENINMALGNGQEPGGFAKGKIVEIAGESSSGKTSLALETIGLDHQKDPESVWGWLDTEGDFDRDYAESKGIDMDRLIIWEVDDVGAEEGLDTLEMLIRSNALKGIVVNSVTGLTPKKELENKMEKAEVALQARMMSKLMRKITAICNRTKTTVVFINQLRTNVGVMYGDPNTTTGGKALAFFATQRINLRKVKVQKEDGITEEQGIKVNVKVAKNRAAHDNPYKATSYTALFGHGIDYVRELGQLAQEAGIATSGGWVYIADSGTPSKDNTGTWKGQKMAWNGKSKFLDFIRADEEFQEELRARLRGLVKVDALDASEIEAIQEAEKAIAEDFDSLPDLPEEE